MGHPAGWARGFVTTQAAGSASPCPHAQGSHALSQALPQLPATGALQGHTARQAADEQAWRAVQPVGVRCLPGHRWGTGVTTVLTRARKGVTSAQTQPRVRGHMEGPKCDTALCGGGLSPEGTG